MNAIYMEDVHGEKDEKKTRSTKTDVKFYTIYKGVTGELRGGWSDMKAQVRRVRKAAGQKKTRTTRENYTSRGTSDKEIFVAAGKPVGKNRQ